MTPLEAPTSEDDRRRDPPDETTDETDADETTDETLADDGAREAPEDAEDAEAVEAGLEAWVDEGPEGYGSFGEWVSEGATGRPREGLAAGQR